MNGLKRNFQASNLQERDAWLQALKETIQKLEQGVDFGKTPVLSPETQEPAKRKKMMPEDFNFLKVLGKGNYGKVMLATRKDELETKYYAIKAVKKSGLVDAESVEHVLAEKRVLQTMDHPFLVKLYYSFQTEDRLYFVMEYVRGGELFFHIGREGKFTENRVRMYAAEMLSALTYLHSKGIVYR